MWWISGLPSKNDILKVLFDDYCLILEMLHSTFQKSDLAHTFLRYYRRPSMVFWKQIRLELHSGESTAHKEYIVHQMFNDSKWNFRLWSVNLSWTLVIEVPVERDFAKRERSQHREITWRFAVRPWELRARSRWTTESTFVYLYLPKGCDTNSRKCLVYRS